MGGDLDVVRELDALSALDPSSTFAVVASHGIFDEESLEKAAGLGLPYIGFVTSPRRRDQVFAALRAKGVAAEELERVHAPAGIELGARQPQEIALSVMAEIVSVRRGKADEAAKPAAMAAPARRELALQAGAAHAVAAPVESCCHGTGSEASQAAPPVVLARAGRASLAVHTPAPAVESCCHGTTSSKST